MSARARWMGTVACVALAASSVGARTLPAQALTKIGATSAGTPVMLEAKSVKRDKALCAPMRG